MTGNGIASITKTGTSGLVDTYTITYTNGNTTTFTITNGEDGEVTETELDVLRQNDTELKNDISKNADEITNLKNENAYLQNVVKQAFTETSASGTELTIDNTIEARMEMKLNGNTSQNTTTGKNLLNGKYINTFTQNGITLKHNNDNSFDITGTATSNTSLFPVYNIDQSNLVVGNTYYFYMSEKYDGTNLNVSLVTNTPKLSYWIANKAYTIEENQKFNNITLYIPSGVTMNYHNVKFMIVQGSTATSYEPYTGGIASPNPDYPQDIKVVTGDNQVKISNSDNTQSQSYPISLGSLELCKIGDYQDYLYKKDGKWYVHKETMKEIFDTVVALNKPWDTSYQTISHSFKSFDNILKGTNPFYSNNFECTREDTRDLDSEQLYNYSSNNEIYLFLSYSRLNGVNYQSSDKEKLDAINNWLKQNPTYVYYVSNAPTDKEITDTTLISQLNELSQALSKKGTTIISQSNDDLPFNLDVIALTK